MPIFYHSDSSQKVSNDTKTSSDACDVLAAVLVTILLFQENLSDQQVIAPIKFTVGTRIDWKYMLDLVLINPGFDFSAQRVLCTLFDWQG